MGHSMAGKVGGADVGEDEHVHVADIHNSKLALGCANTQVRLRSHCAKYSYELFIQWRTIFFARAKLRHVQPYKLKFQMMHTPSRKCNAYS